MIAVARTISEELAELRGRYGDAALRFVACDLREPGSIKESVFGAIGNTPVRGLVNNAAMAYDDLVTNFNAERMAEMFQVNVVAAMELTKLAIRNMLLHRTAGSLVHLSSVSVHTGYKGLSMYAATKGAIEAFSKNVAREWGSKGIRSNCVVAGFMETDMSAMLTDEQRARIYNRTALKRATDKNSVAAMVEFLLSEKSASITGQSMFVDAGTI